MTGSYYTPAGTVGVRAGPPDAPVEYHGEEAHTIIVASDMARRVEAINSEGVVWRLELPTSWPRGLALHEGLLWVADGRDLRLLNPATGAQHKHWSGIVPAAINGISVTTDADGTHVTLALDAYGPQSVVCFGLHNLDLAAPHTCPHPAIHPRGAYRLGGWMFVADTFGDRVFAYDIASGGMRAEALAFFPNTIEPASVAEVRITEEHANRVLVWNTPSGERRVEACAPVWPFSDPNCLPDTIGAHEAATFNHAGQPAFEPPKSIAAAEYNDGLTLYSPNSATMTPHGLLITDTDNHRVILVRANAVVLEITGFNNPVNAVLI